MISITKRPIPIAPAFSHDGVVFEVSSTEEAPGLNIRADIYVKSNLYDDPVIVGRKRQSEFQNKFRFDISGMLQGQLSHDVMEGSGQYITPQTPGSAVRYFVKFTEEFIVETTGLYTEGESLVTPHYHVVNSCIDAGENFENYVCANTTDGIGKFLTNQPLKKLVRPGEVEQLHFCTDGEARLIINNTLEGEEPSTIEDFLVHFGVPQLVPIGHSAWEASDFQDLFTGAVPFQRSGWKFNAMGCYPARRQLSFFPAPHLGLARDQSFIKFNDNGNRVDNNNQPVKDAIITEYISDLEEFSFLARAVVDTRFGSGQVDLFVIPNYTFPATPPLSTLTLYGWDGTSVDAFGKPLWVSIQSWQPADSTAMTEYHFTGTPASIQQYVRFKLESDCVKYCNIALQWIKMKGRNFNPASFAFKRGVLHVGNVFEDTNLEEVQVWLEDENGDRISEIRTFCKDTRCKPDHSVRLAWLNRLGGIDCYTFTAKRVDKNVVNKTSIENQLPYNYGHQDATRRTLAVESDTTTTIYAEISGKEETDWFVQVHESPAVYLIDDITGKVTPIVLTSEPKEHYSSEDLSIVALTYVRSVRKTIQHG